MFIIPLLLQTFSLLTTSLPIFTSTPNSNPANTYPTTKELLRVNPNNEFQITIFADLHYGEEEDGWGIDQDVNSSRVIRDVISHETSDLVVLNG